MRVKILYIFVIFSSPTNQIPNFSYSLHIQKNPLQNSLRIQKNNSCFISQIHIPSDFSVDLIMKSSSSKPDTSSSSSNLRYTFPTKSYASLVFMEEFMKDSNKQKQPPLHTLVSKCKESWDSMSDARKNAYREAADERNFLYMKNLDAYNKWVLMTATEKAPFILKAKEPYAAKIDNIRRTMTREGVNEDDDWNGDYDFDTYAFFIFCEETEKIEIEESIATMAFRLYRNGYLGTRRNVYPHEFADAVVTPLGWFESWPVDAGAAAAAKWDTLTPKGKAKFFGQAKTMFEIAMAGE